MSEAWITTLTMLAAFGAGFGFLWREMVRRFETIDVRLARIEDRLDHSFDVLREQGERIARLELPR